MKVLFLDDERWRHDAVDRALKGHEVHHVYSFRQFRSKVGASREWGLVMLDHDLGSTANGYTAANMFAEAMRGVEPRCPCIVHSWNPAGATRMVGLLRHFGHPVIREPFGATLLERILPELVGGT